MRNPNTKRKQAKATQTMLENTKQLLDYLATHPDAKIKIRASDMILNIHSDASYLSAKDAHNKTADIFFLG